MIARHPRGYSCTRLPARSSNSPRGGERNGCPPQVRDGKWYCSSKGRTRPPRRRRSDIDGMKKPLNISKTRSKPW